MSDVLETCLRRLHEFLARPEFAQELNRAKAGYFEQVGAPKDGEPFVELRLASFIEWFLFERTLDRRRQTPIELYLSQHGPELSEQERELCLALTKSLHRLFQVKKVKNGEAVLRDLIDKKKYKSVRNLPLNLHAGDMAELRLVPLGKEYVVTEAYCYHPSEANKFILAEAKRARKNGDDPIGLMRRLMAMSTKWERYPRMKVSEIYK
jgi:hypothetical protein